VIRRSARLAWLGLKRFLEHNGPDRAAAVAYYTLLSLLPLFIFVISLGRLFLGSFEAAYQGTLVLLGGVVVHMDEQTLRALRSFVESSIRFQWPGLLLLAWTAKRIFASLFSALESVFESRGRGYAKGNLLAFAMVFVTGMGMLITMALTTVLATAEGLLRRTGVMEDVLNGIVAFVLAQVLPVFVTFAFFFIVYRLAPHRDVTAGHALIGALLATVLWEAAKAGFAFYVRNLAHYAGMYGALEGVIVLALWLELSISIVLYSGEVVALTLPPPNLTEPSREETAPA
jgi:membrane protein